MRRSSAVRGDRAAGRGDQRRTWLPSQEQEWLLQAALLQGPRGVEAWEQWKARVDLEALDAASYRLLPQLFRTLERRGISDPAMGRFKGAYRRTWCENQVFLHAMSHVLRSLHDAGIDTLILKGAPLVLQYYRDYGLRPMDDLDILVSMPHVSPAVSRLKHLGYSPVWDTRDETVVLASRHGWDFKDAAGRQVDLHWRAFYEAYVAPDVDREFWNGAVPLTIHGVPGRTLNAADQLLHVCVHGATWMKEMAVRWVADSMAILRAAGGDLDWDRLLVQARRYRFTLLVWAALTYLRDVVDAPVPAAVLQRMNEMPASRAERIVYTAKTQPPERWGPWVALNVRYLEHCSTLPASTGTLRRLAGFPRYFGRRWGARSLLRIPLAAAFRGTRRIAWAVRSGMSQAGPRPSVPSRRA